MGTIPSTQKFHTVSSSVDTMDYGSEQLSEGRAVFTMQDILDTTLGDILAGPLVTEGPIDIIIPNEGIIFTAPNGSRWKQTIDDNGFPVYFNV